jgi:ATP-binding cassette, subfamily B, bacterial HlyB/CyaB
MLTTAAAVEATNRNAPSGGLAALAHVAGSHGITTTPAELRRESGVTGTQFTAAELIRVARRLGLKSRLITRRGGRDLSWLPPPSLLRDRQGKWFVLGARISRDFYRVIDPVGKSERRLSTDEIWTEFAGEIIVFSRQKATESAANSFGLGWFFVALAKYRQALSHVLIASFVIQIFALATPVIFQLVVDKVLVHKSASTLAVLTTAMVGISAFDVVLKFIRSYLLAHTSSRVDVELGIKLFAHLLRLPISYFEHRPAGVTISRVRELETIRTFLTGQGLLSIIDLLFVFVSVAVLFVYSTVLGALVLASLPVYVVITSVVRPRLRARLLRRFDAWSASQQFVAESVFGMQTLKASAVEALTEQDWENRLAEYVRAGFRATLTGTKGQLGIEFVTKVSTAVTLFVGAEEVVAGNLTVGALVAFNMIANQVVQPVLRMSQLWQDLQQVQISVERLGDILNAQPEPHSLGRSGESVRLRGRIEFRDVTFRYSPDGPAAISNLSLDIKAGEVLGVIGPSGSGKSTLAKLLQRMYAPTSGSILIDGYDIAQLSPMSIRRQMGVVLQDGVLFRKTIHENIALARPDLDRGTVVRLAQLSGAHEFIVGLPLGYDSIVEERGANFSGGQRQRLSIARALAGDPRILIFDEATSALDVESEQIIQSKMADICRGRTVIIIAHRLAAVRRCNRIIGVSGGELVEAGTHATLLNRTNGLYARLWSMQTEPSYDA